MKTPIQILLDNVEWRALTVESFDDTLPYATHEGVLDFGGAKFKVYQLNDGQRVFDVKDVEKFFQGGES